MSIKANSGDAPIIDVIEGNKLIAEFMGAKDFMNSMRFGEHPSIGIGKYYDYKDLRYHTSWDWLMPVVEKIESLDFISDLGDGDSISYRVIVGIAKNYCKIEPGTSIILPLGIKSYQPKKIDSAFIAIVQFIEWYNQQKQQ